MSDLNKIEAIPATEYAMYDKIQACIREVLKKKKDTPEFVNPLICSELWYMCNDKSYRVQFLLDNDKIGALDLELNSVLTEEMLEELYMEFDIKLPVYGDVVEFKVEPVGYYEKMQIDRYIAMLNDKLAKHRHTFKSFVASITNTKEVPIERVSCGITSRAITALLHRGVFPNDTTGVWYDANTPITLPTNSEMETVIDVPDHALIMEYTVDIPKEVVERFEKMGKL